MTSHAVRRDTHREVSVGAYEPLFELGRGGMGTVYLARALGAGGFERLTVLKRLNSHLHNQPDAVRRFLDEARVAAQVHHANVIGTHHVGSDDGGPYLILEYVEGGSLDDLRQRALERGEQIPASVVLRIAADALAGLHAVHVAQDASGRPLNILHRDVSLQNVLVGRDGVSRIADFGIAKSTLGSVSTDKAYVVGKLLYMPREYLCREDPTPSLDVYSLGITMWLSVSGSDIWPGASDAQLIKHIVDDDVPRLSTVVRVPTEVDDLVARAVARDPQLRYQNARSMSEDIERLARKTGGVATHGEVAQFVESLMGPELRARRESIAKAIAASAKASSSDVSSNRKIAVATPAGRGSEKAASAAPVTRHDRPWAGPALGDESEDEEDEVTVARDAPHEVEALAKVVSPEPASRRKAPIVLLIVGALAAAAAFFGLWGNGTPEEPNRAAEPPPKPAATAAPVAKKAAAGATPEPPPTPSAAPVTTNSASPRPTDESGAPQLVAPRRAPSGTSTRRQKAGAEKAREIGKNPYR